MEIKVYNFEPELKNAFIEMNEFWIKRDYVLEEEDKRILSEIDNEVKKGAKIYFAIYNNIPISTLCLTKIKDGEYELIKFATRDGYYNIGAGRKVLEYALNDAKTFAKKIIIATNKKCSSAIHLYEEYGFKEFDSDKTYGFSTDRVDICFYLNL